MSAGFLGFIYSRYPYYRSPKHLVHWKSTNGSGPLKFTNSVMFSNSKLLFFPSIFPFLIKEKRQSICSRLLQWRSCVQVCEKFLGIDGINQI